MIEKPVTIKTIAKKVGIGVETIRYYQRIGLIEAPAKPLSGYRIYGKDILERLLFIQRAKELGFSLTEISTLLSLGDGGGCRETKELALHKLEFIKGKLHDLQVIANTLEGLIQSCDTNSDPRECPLIKTIFKS